MDQKENNENNRIKNIKIKTKRIHIQKHKSNNPYTKHNNK